MDKAVAIKSSSGDLETLFHNHFLNQTYGHHEEEVYEAVKYFLALKSKRIRPVLLLHAAELFEGHVTEALPAACAIEFFHNFSLVHDDIMDEAELRRGKPTIHRQFNLGTAIIAGDLMLILAYEHLAAMASPIVRPALKLFNEAAHQIIEGQQKDTTFESLSAITVQEYITMVEQKTGILFATALQLGGMASHASEPAQELLYRFGLNLGVCFQIKDDWLDVYGNKKVGKKIGGDIIRNKKTFLFARAWDCANADQRTSLRDLRNIKNEEEKIAQALAIYASLGIEQQTELEMNAYFKKAMDYLEAIKVREEDKEELRSFAWKVFNRNY